MIYFIVNNDFHMEHIEYYIDDIDKSKFIIIKIPYSFKAKIEKKYNVLTFLTPFREKMNFLKKAFLVYKIKRKISSKLKFNKTDKVIILTEYDILNQFIIYLAKKEKAKTYILQEGIATYYTNINRIDEALLSIQERIRLSIIRHIYGFKYSNYIKLGKNIYPIMHDKFIDGMFLYYDFNLKRDINKLLITSPYKTNYNLLNNYSLFLNQPLYESFLTESEYFLFLKKELLLLKKKNKKILFKFHPRDHSFIKKELKIFFDKNKIEIVNDNLAFAEVIKKFLPLDIYSFFSDALLKLELQGHNVHYLFKNSEVLRNNEVLKSIDSFLNAREKVEKSNLNFKEFILEN